jgi:NADPH:quinone reductase-like Zn-dependent oxidoreductase
MSMKAVVHDDYGGPEVLRIVDVATPSPGPNDILVKVRAAAVNPADWHLFRGVPIPIRMVTGGFRRPTRQRRVGADFSGTIEAIGAGVTGFAAGDAVFGLAEGSLSEYLTVPADTAVLKSERISFEQAAGVPIAGLTALQLLRDKTKLRAGHRVLIVGAAGGIGTFAVQIAKAWGAHVTGVQSTSALDLVRSLGADRVIDYTKDDFTTGDARYDVVLDNVCNRTLSDVRRVVKPRGTLVPNGGGSPDKNKSILGMIRAIAMGPFISQRVVFGVTKPNRADLQLLAGMIETGTVTPVIDSVYPLAAVADAYRRLEAGHAHGKVVVMLEGQAWS